MSWYRERGFTSSGRHDQAHGLRAVLRRLLAGTWLLLVLLLVAGCVGTEVSGGGLDANNILLWHSWPRAQADVLEEVLTQIGEIDPDVGVITIYVEPDEVLERYVAAIDQGIGPDLLLGPADWVGALASAEAVRSIPDDLRFLLEFRTNTLDAVRVDDTIYGIPMAVGPNALYVNTELANDVPTGLGDLPGMTSADAPFAMVPRFVSAYWGIATFGSGLFDSKGRFTLADSGFTEWLTWLESAQHNPGIILNSDEEALRDLFMQGRAAYYVGGPDELAAIGQRIGQAQLAVVRLPNGPFGPAGPLLSATAVMQGTNSSDSQAEVAQFVANFLTNRQQSTTFMRELGHIPANADVAVDPRIYPILGGFARQATTGVTLPNTLDLVAMEISGNRAYINVLSGLMTPEEAVCVFGLQVIEQQGLDEAEVDLPLDCEYLQPPTEDMPATD